MKMMNHSKKVAVLGAGTMGNGIAHSFAQHGYSVSLFDVSGISLKKAVNTIETNLKRQLSKGNISSATLENTLDNIQPTPHLELALENAELVIEAIVEQLQPKSELLSNVSRFVGEETIIASNTSSIPIAKLAENCLRPHVFVGMHFFNPVPLMPLVEVVKSKYTHTIVVDRIFGLSNSIGKTPVLVNDFPGFVSNRVLMPMINEAVLALEQGVAGVIEIDTVMRLGMAHPMGPLKLADFIGLDVCLFIMNVLFEGLGEKYQPAGLLLKMANSGLLGAKTGEGFYTWENKEAKPSTSYMNYL